MNPNCTILVASTTWWSSPARLAMAFLHNGCDVIGICPAGSPLNKVSKLRKTFKYGALTPKRSLADAMQKVSPDLVIPCDDLVVSHLHSLHADKSADPAVRQTIEQSLGHPAFFPETTARGRLLSLAASLGIACPRTEPVSSLTDLAALENRRPFPWVIKSDGSCSGSGVRIAKNPAEAARAFSELQTPPTLLLALKEYLVNRNPYVFNLSLAGRRPAITVQEFVAGQPANILFSAWQGRVLASISVEVIDSANRLGSATAIRVVRSQEMLDAACSLADKLALSGLYGLDFILDQETQRPVLIEMNPRSTQTGHLSLGPDCDVTGTLISAVRPGFTPPATDSIANDVIALFPQLWSQNPQSPLMRSAHHDVPWGEPELVRELVKPSWARRGPLVRGHAAVQRKLDVWKASTRNRLAYTDLSAETGLGAPPIRNAPGSR